MTKFRTAYNVNTGEFVLVNAAHLKQTNKMQLAQMRCGAWALVTLTS